jgi:undecaprenyl phosphate-alpha-L-ara4FN deformylase
VIDGKPLNQPQIPVTLPTYDEAIGRSGVTRPNYNDHILSLLRPRGLNVLTIHAEVEGILCRDLFADFLDRAVSKGVTFRPLRALLPDSPAEIPWGRIQQDAIPGREGCVACQAAPPGATGDQTP